jgi:hypothetical protein
MGIKNRSKLFWIFISMFCITFFWLIWAFYNIKGMDIIANITMSTFKVAVKSTEIDIPISPKNVRTVLWQIGIPLYFNLISVCCLIRLLPQDELKKWLEARNWKGKKKVTPTD